MSWFRKPLVFATVLMLAVANAPAKNSDDTKPAPEKGASKKGAKGDKKDDQKGKLQPSAEKGPQKLSIPVPPGHDAKGLVIPYRDALGHMQMRFTMDLGSRTDENHMAMKTLLIETFDDGGAGEMTIDLPESILDLNTRVITTQTGVVIKRADFELRGKTMEFNTETRAGVIGGKVRMLIYNLENETDTSDEATPPIEK